MNLFTDSSVGGAAGRLQWLNEPSGWRLDGHGRLHVAPEAETDFFRPIDRPGHDNAGLLAAPVTGDFTARAGLRATLAGFGDAGALTVRSGPEQWAKICVERSPVGEVSIVSVVTDPWSDDANSEVLSVAQAHLRLTRSGDLFGMHYSTDGRRWRFVRAFGMQAPAEVWVGVHAQAPFVAGCSVRFDYLEIDRGAVADFRSGE